MLAPRRTARVNGRIIKLTDSISTINGIRGAGVPSGTRWAMFILNCFTNLNIIYPSQMGKDKARVNDKWLLEVKTYGNSPNRLVKRIKKNNVKKNNIAPGAVIPPKATFSSATKALIIIVTNFSIFLLINQYIWGKNKIVETDDNQFKGKVKLNKPVLGLNEENRSPILDF